MRACRFLASSLLFAACLREGAPVDYGDPTEPSDPNALTLAVDAPVDFASVSEPSVVVAGRTGAGAAVPEVTVAVGSGPTVAVAVADGGFAATVALVHGENTVAVVAALSDAGSRAEVERRVTYSGDAPGLSWRSPATDGPVGGATLRAMVVATARDGGSIAGVQMSAGAATVLATCVASADAGAASAPDAGVDAGGAYWVADVPLPAAGATIPLVATATDSFGAATTSTRTLPHDLAPPSIVIAAPDAGAVFSTSAVTIAGTASDDLGLARILVRVGDAGSETAAGTTAWSLAVELDPGTHTLTATAYDLAGQATSASVAVSVSRIITLRAPTDGGDLTLTIDKNGLDQLITDDNEKQITLLYIDLDPLLLAGIDAIKDPAAAGLDASAWGAAELNMQRLLTMTPDNANLTGTSLEELLTLAPNLGLPPARLLADIAGDPDAGGAVDSPFLASRDISSAILRNLIWTHPNIDTDPADGKKKVRANLYDALRNCATFASRFGAIDAGASSHPGFLTGTTNSTVLKSDFQMTIVARSNLTVHEGVNPATGKGYLFVNRDPNQSTILEFDFVDPARFKVDGIADEPTVDMTFIMSESPSFIATGTIQTAGRDDAGADAGADAGVVFYKGSSAGWNLSRTLIEYIVLEASYLAQRTRYAATSYQTTLSYDVGAITPAATVAWNKGWVTMWTAGGLGNPPAPAYIWDHLLEAAQVRLHDQGVSEGDAGVRFALTRIPLGLTGDELKEKIRPQMEAQKNDLSQMILGDQTSYTSAVAFYRKRGADGADYLFFTSAGDIPGASPYPYTTPGFFNDAALTQKASTTAAGTSGDSTHEKVTAYAPATFFIRGADGIRYRVALIDYVGTDLRLRVEPLGP